MDFELPILILLIFLSGAFSGSEIALTSLTEAKVRSMEGDNKFGSAAVLKLKQQPQRLLISILIGNQVINVVATVIATIWAIRIFGQDHLSLATTIFTIILILFGAITPKSIALRFSAPFARIMAYPLLAFIYLARPVIWIFELLIRGILHLLRADKKELPSTSEREIEAMLDISAEKGVIEEEEEIFMKHILKFSETKVEEIMTLLKDIDAIDIEITKEDLIKFFKEHNHIHFPVYQKSLNNMKGILSVHDLVQTIYHSRRKQPLLRHRFVSPVVVPKTTSLTELFKEFKGKHHRIAIVVDEHGQTIGLVTLGDILEEIAGVRIEKNKNQPEPKIEKISKNLWEADGEITINKINQELGFQLHFSDHQTIGLIVLETLKRFPEPEEKIIVENLEIEILKIEKNIIKKVGLRKKQLTKKALEKTRQVVAVK